MTITDAAPTTAELEAARLSHLRATVRLLAGVTVSVAGIVFMIAVFVFYVSLGSNPSGNQGLGAILLMVPAFALSAWGTDVRKRANTQRRGLRERIRDLAHRG